MKFRGHALVWTLSLCGPLALAASSVHGCSASSDANDGTGNNGTGNNGTGNNGAGGFGIDGGDGSLGDGDICAADSFPGVLAPLDLYIMLDRSSSMSEGSKWTAVTAAFYTFLSAPECDGIGVGIGYFPVAPAVPPPTRCDGPGDCGYYGPCFMGTCLGGTFTADTSCDPADYDEPDVPIAELPGVRVAMETSLGSHSPEGSATPSKPSMEGAVTYATAWAQANPTHMTFIVYATDGEPTGCGLDNTIDDTAALAAAAAAGSPPVKTFVIGVGSSLTGLHQIAIAGGTGQAFLVDTGSGVTDQFIDALNQIRAEGECQFQIPEPAEGELDFDMVNLTIYDPDDREATEKTIPYVGSEAGCDPVTGGWYYDDPADPHKIILCPATCDEVRLSDWSVSVQIGCKTIAQ